MMKPVAFLFSLCFFAVQPAGAVQTPAQKDFKLGSVRIAVNSEALRTLRDGKEIARVPLNTESSEAFLIPQKQPLTGFFFVKKEATANPRIVVVNKKGAISELQTGEVFVTPGKDLLFTLRTEDSGTISYSVLDLKASKVLASVNTSEQEMFVPPPFKSGVKYDFYARKAQIFAVPRGGFQAQDMVAFDRSRSEFKLQKFDPKLMSEAKKLSMPIADGAWSPIDGG